MRFVDRVDAGRRLATALRRWAPERPVVLGLPRGGVPVAYEVARALGAPLDVVVVRKLGVPGQPELGMGAVGESGVVVVNRDVMRFASVPDEQLALVERDEAGEVERRARLFRGDRPRVPLDGRTAIVVDDGVATGSTARAACQVVRALGAAKVVLAVPVGPVGLERRMQGDADEVVCLAQPREFYAVGQLYDDFEQVGDRHVIEVLQRAYEEHAQRHAAAAPAGESGRDEDVVVHAGTAVLAGHLAVPPLAGGIVVFAHGSGSSRHSPRNRYVAHRLNEHGLATLLFDLLTEKEEHDRANVFDIELLARRLGDATAWLRRDPQLADLPQGYFGASTGAAAALWSAAEAGPDVAAVVSRGGRPDLAGRKLDLVRAPTLLIVGGDDDTVLGLNREAQVRLPGENRLEIVRGATHLFEEPGALEQVARLAADWFRSHLVAAVHPAP